MILRPRNALLFLSSLIVPAGFILFLAWYLLPETRFPASMGIPIGTAWGAMGGAVHFMSLKRGMRYRIRGNFLLLGFSLLVAMVLFWAFPRVASNLYPCPVCGFVSLEEPGATCPVCEVEFSEVHAAMEGFGSLQELLTAEQMIYFQPAQGDTVVDFFAPCNCEGNYAKSKDWQPSVTKKDVLEVRGMVVGKTPQ